MKGKANHLLVTLFVMMSVIILGSGSIKADAARTLPVGGLATHSKPVCSGVTVLPADTPKESAPKLEPRRATLSTGRHYQYLTAQEKELYATFYCAVSDGKYIPYSKHNNENEFASYRYAFYTGDDCYWNKYSNFDSFWFAFYKAMFAVQCDHPNRVEFDMVAPYGFEAYALNGVYTTYVTLRAEADEMQFASYDAAIDASVDAIVAEVKRRGATSEWDAVNEKIAYEYYCGDYNLEYDMEGLTAGNYHYCHTAYGSLVLHKAVCDGYSKGLALILDKLGVTVMINDGIGYYSGSGGGHAWNMVQLDGNWYEMDSTWDDGDGNAVTWYFFNRTTADYKKGITPPESVNAKHIRITNNIFVSFRYPSAMGEKWTEEYISAGNFTHDTVIPVNNISFDNSTYVVKPETRFALTPKFAPENTTQKDYYLLTSDSSVVDVDSEKNELMAYNYGTATITAVSAEDDTITAECMIIVSDDQIRVTGISVPKEITIDYGYNYDLEVTFTPANATNQSFEIESSDKNIVLVNEDGSIRGVNKGTATLTVRSADGAFVAECNATVEIANGTVFTAGGCEYEITGKNTAALISGAKKTKLNIPDAIVAAGGTFKITSIADNAFMKSKKLKKVSGGKNLTSIGRDAFNQCANLTKVDLSKSKVSKIGYQAFYKCKKLSNISLNGDKLKSSEKDIITGIKTKAKVSIYTKKAKNYKNAVKVLEGTGAKKVTYKQVKK